ncbi:hypothetical protein FRB99_004279 [Tulasnella sp. 403]|nr:hypothetical protein FRB99_004279 [Tulasnella sp. 403]
MALQVPGTSVEPPPVSLAKATATVAVASPPSQSPAAPSQPPSSAGNNSLKVVISVLIAMPDASRPSYVPHYVRSTDNALQAPDHATDSESQRESEKGKSKAPNHSNADGVQGDGELPDVLFGIFESDWKGSQGSKDGHDTLSAKPNDV